jgi:hypothetical protein
LIEFFLLSNKVIPSATTVACSITSTKRFIWRSSHWPIIHRYFVFLWMWSSVQCIKWQRYWLPRVQPIQLSWYQRIP